MTATLEELLGGIERQDAQSIPLGLQTILLFGESGTGKTTLCSHIKDHLYLDLEGGAKNRDGIKVPKHPIKTWAVFRAVIETIADGTGPVTLFGEPLTTLVIDTVDKLFDLCRQHVHAQMRVEGADFEKFGAQYIRPRNEFKEVIDLLLRLHEQQRMGTVFIAHEHREEIITPTRVLTKFRPQVSDKHWREELPKSMQLVLWSRRLDQNPITQEQWDRQRFLLQTKVLEVDAVVKDRTDRLPALLPMSYDALEQAYSATNNTNGATQQ